MVDELYATLPSDLYRGELLPKTKVVLYTISLLPEAPIGAKPKAKYLVSITLN